MQKAPNLVIDVSKCSSFCKSDGQMREKTRYSTKKPPWRLLGSQMAPWRPLGGPWAPKFFWGKFWDSFGHPFWLQKSSKIVPKFSRKSSTGFGRHFWPTGSLLEPFWGRFGVYFGVFFRSSAYRFPPDRPNKFHNLFLTI